jgi:outer membrane protein assembly factor BamD
MKKILFILALVLLAGCAAKEEPFDPVAKFREAEGYMRKESFEKARKAYQELQEKAPDKSYDADIMLRVADTYFGEEKYDEALVEYQGFLNFHPVNRNAAYAQYQIAMCSFKQLPTTDRDQALPRTALREFQTLAAKYPNSTYAAEAKKDIAILTDHIAEYELYVARFYHKKGAYVAALGRLDGLLRNYPSSLAEKEALYYAALCHLELGERDKARKDLDTLVRKYPSMTDAARPLFDRIAKR